MKTSLFLFAPEGSSSASNTQNANSRSSVKILFGVIIFLLLIIVGGVAFWVLKSPTNPSVQITNFTPSGLVPQTTNFTLTFSQEVVPDSMLEKPVNEPILRFSPELPGEARWIRPNTLRFYPEATLRPATQYTITVDSKFVQKHGFSLTGKRTFSCATPPLQVEGVSFVWLYNRKKAGTVQLQGRVRFNYAVPPALFAEQSVLKIEKGARIPIEVKTNEPAREIVFVSHNLKIPAKPRQVVLRILQGLTCEGGQLGLSEDVVKRVALRPKPELHVQRAWMKYHPNGESEIFVLFNQPLSPEEVKPFISITPTLPVRLWVDREKLIVRGPFKKETAYVLRLKKGLPSLEGSKLKHPFEQTVLFRKVRLEPEIYWKGNGYYLTKNGHLNLGLVTVNISRVSLEVQKVYANNLCYLLNTADNLSSQYGYWYPIQNLGRKILEVDTVVAERENQKVVTPISVENFLKGNRHGIFKLTARATEQGWRSATRWVLVTDMGLLAKKAGDALWVWVNSISTLKPVAGAKVKLYSRNNQLLLKGTTNAQGVVVFKSYQAAVEGFQPFVLTASTPNDFTFLALRDTRLATSDFDVSGIVPLKNGYSAYVYPERDIYRPGETVRLAVIVRDAHQSVPEAFPVRLRVVSPNGRLVDEQKITLNEQGGGAFNVFIPRTMLTGRYVARVYIAEKKPIGEAFFHVEEFLPDRMKVTVSTDQKAYRPGENVKIFVEAHTLFGTPATNRIVRAHVTLESAPFVPSKWRSFTFTDKRKSFKKMVKKFVEKHLNQKGETEFTWHLPDSIRPPSSLKAVFSATVLEPGGRGVTAFKTVTVYPGPVYVGLKPVAEGYAAPNRPFFFKTLALRPDGQLAAGRSLKVAFYRVVWQTVARRGGRLGIEYQSVPHEKLVRTFEIRSAEKPVAFSVTPDDYGDYRVVVTDVASGVSASSEFYAAGWGYVPWAMEHPERVELELDKKVYTPGLKAKVLVKSPISGRLLITVEGEEIFSQKVYRMKNNTAEIEIPVEKRFKPNVYISAHVIRSPLNTEDKLPLRAFGVVPLMVSTQDNRLQISVRAPEKIQPNRELPISIRAKNGTGSIYTTVAVVDEGICQLTGFRTPDPMDFFFGKRKLMVDSYDIYGNILPELRSKSSPSGGMALQARRHLTLVHVKRVKHLSFWSGLLKLNSRGEGKVRFKIPEFNGSLRIMVVAFSGNHFGSAQKNVLVRNPIVVTPTFPRFLAPQDAAVIPVAILNGTGGEALFTAKLTATGPVHIQNSEEKIRIPEGKEKTVFFDIRAAKTFGKALFTLQVSGAGKTSESKVALPVRPAAKLTTRSGSGTVKPGQPVQVRFNTKLLPGTARYSLILSGFPSLELGGSLHYLLHYPYGCLEQTVSSVFPLLYFKDVAQAVAPELFLHNSADYFIAESIAKIERMQLPGGMFGAWPNSSVANPWASVYAAHFLVEARRLGYAVSDAVYRKMLKGLKNVALGYSENDRWMYERTAYACYVLALANHPQRGSMNYLKNNALDQLPLEGQFLLAGAFAEVGDVLTARRLLPQKVTIPSEKLRQSGDNFYSDARATAVMLLVFEKLDPQSPFIPVLVKNLMKTRQLRTRWYTTQENAFALLALGKTLHNRKQAHFTGTVKLDGKTLAQFGTKEVRLEGKDWGGKTLEIATQGTGLCYYYWQASGISVGQNFPEQDNDLVVRRRYLTEDGQPIPYNTMRQGDLVIAEISIQSPYRSLKNVAIVDLLPACLEIENPRLQSREAVQWVSSDTLNPAYMDIRDDRLQLFVNLPRKQMKKFYYGLRVVTEGQFFLPFIQAEAMYAPEVNSTASSGKMTVVGAFGKQ